MTLLAEKLKEAGYQGEKDSLYVAAVEALQQSGGNIERAVTIFRGYLAIVAKDMNSGRETGAGHFRVETQQLTAGVKSESGGSHPPIETQLRHGPVVLRPINREARAMAALAVQKVKASIFDTFTFANGKSARQTSYNELQAIARKADIDGRVARAVLNHIRRPAEGGRTIADLCKPADLELWIEQAERAND